MFANDTLRPHPSHHPYPLLNNNVEAPSGNIMFTRLLLGATWHSKTPSMRIIVHTRGNVPRSVQNTHRHRSVLDDAYGTLQINDRSHRSEREGMGG